MFQHMRQSVSDRFPTLPSRPVTVTPSNIAFMLSSLNNCLNDQVLSGGQMEHFPDCCVVFFRAGVGVEHPSREEKQTHEKKPPVTWNYTAARYLL